MINNQLLSPVNAKAGLIPGTSSDEGKKDESNQQGGLFKLLMNSVQDGDASGKEGKKGNSSASNILGGNLTLNTQKDGDAEQSVLRMLAGSDEGSKEEKITLSKLLEGPGSNVESDENVDNESASDEAQATDEVAQETETEEKDESDKADVVDNQPADSEVSDEVTDENQAAGEEVHENIEKEEAQAAEETSKDIKAASSENSTNNQNRTNVKPDGTPQDPTQQNATQQDATQQAVAAEAKGENAAAKSGESPSKGEGSSNPVKGLMVNEESGSKSKSGEAGKVPADGSADKESRENRVEVKELLKSEGLVNELRALAATRGEQGIAGQAGGNVRPEEIEEVNEQPGTEAVDEGKLLQDIFSALQTGSIEQAAAEIRSLKASQMRETRYTNYLSSFGSRQEISAAESAASLGSGISSMTSATNSLSMMPVSAMVPTGAAVTSELFDENGAVLWKEQITEYFESNEKSASENQAAAAFARLGEVPVTNISVRRSFAQGISQAIMSSTGDGKKASETWQKHSFLLEDGKNIQVSARQVEGVLQLKLSSSFTELNKLLMEHENEIRELLENELELKIDLQMNGGGEGQMGDFFGKSSDKELGKGGPLNLGSRKTKEQPVEEVVPKAVRKFGYNQMEWTG